MSYDAKISPAMVSHVTIHKQHQWLSDNYPCNITLNDGRESSGDLKESTLFFLVQIIGRAKISTPDTEFNVTWVDCAYGKFGPSPDTALTELFANVSKKGSELKTTYYTHQMM